MPSLTRIVAACLLSLIALTGIARAQSAQPTYANTGAERDAARYEALLKAHVKKERTAREWRASGEKLLAQGQDPRAAMRAFSSAVVADDKDWASWLGLARALLAIPVEKDGRERTELAGNATGAAYRAYQRAPDARSKADALVALAEAMKRRSLWRPAIDALKASLALADQPATRTAYETLRAEHGFRMLDYKIESDAQAPRLCLQFSELLAKGEVEWSRFVALDGRDPPAITAEGRQLCLEGLAHGKRYDIGLRAGLPSAVPGEGLLKAAELGVYVKDRSPSVRVQGNTYVLPSRGQAGIPLITVNTDAVALEVYRIGDRGLARALQSGDFRRQIESYQARQIRERTGERVWSGEMPVKQSLNEDVTTAFPVGEAIPRMKSGIYVLLAKPAAKGARPADASRSGDEDDEYDSGRGRGATQWFIVSDLGLTAFSGEDGVHAFVRSLGTASPARDIEVRLVARNNEVLATAKTDSRGYARFEAGLAKGEGGQAPAILVAERPGGGEYAFLELASAAFDLTDRGNAGREATAALEALLFAERGVYRPGESVHLTALVRDRLLKAPRPAPITLIVTRPDGVEASRQQVEDMGAGGRAVSLPLSRTAMTGTWRARAHADPKAQPIGEVSFLVEDFLPERLDLALEAQAKVITPDAPGTIALKGRYLYGPPAADLAVEGEVVVRAAKGDLEGYAGFRFGQADEQVAMQRRPLEALPRTDAKGEAKVAIELPAIPRTTRPLEAQIVTRLREPGGRAIERSLVLPIDTRQLRIGVKPLFDTKGLGEGQRAQFELVMLGPDGKPVPMQSLKWELKRIDQRWQWYSRDGAWSYEAVSFARKVADGSSETSSDPSIRSLLSLLAEWGRYRLEVTTAEPGGPMTSVTFNSGWWGSESADSPEMLEVALDRQGYKPGDIAKVTIQAQGINTSGGESAKAMIAVVGRTLLAMHEVEVKGRTTTVPLTVADDWMPGAYVVATLFRPLDEKARRMPSRSIGLKWLELDKAQRSLKVALGVPAKVASGAKLAVPVKLEGLSARDEARVVVAAVDVGIHNLTRFEVPSPEKFFYGQRRMSSEIRDLYGRLIDGMKADKGKLRSGGDGGGGGMAMEGSPPVESPLALFSGIVKPAADGTAKVELDLPAFNGTVRVFAVAWSGDKVGSAKQDVIVRDPVALLVTAPRFLTLGDQARLHVDVHNVEGKEGTYALTVQGDTGASSVPVAQRQVALKPGERRAETVLLDAKQLGATVYGVRVTGPGGIRVERRIALDVKPPGGDIRRVSISSLKPGGKLTLSSDLLAELLPDRAKVTLTAGPAAGLDIAGLLTTLDRYPYGCAEQTTSKALPLVYYNDLVRLAGLKPDEGIKERVQKAIERLAEMQDSSGAFGLWGPVGGDTWLTAYVTDFLTRAKEAGWKVPPRAFGQALDRLANMVSTSQDFQKGGEDLAYALYVLARNGRAPVGELRYWADTRLERFATPLARTQIGAALAMLGDKERSARAFRAAIAAFDGKDDGRFRGDYGSSLRDGAAMLTLVAETGTAREETPRLAEIIGRALASRTHTSTQEQVWMLLAARGLIEDAKRASLSIDGQRQSGVLVRSYGATELKARAVAIGNEGEVDVGAVVTVTGDAATPEPAIAKGFRLERSYFTLDGKPVALGGAQGGALVQNQRLVAVVKVTPTEQKEGRILVVDRLPAGLEIENPRLLDGASTKALPWLAISRQPAHAEFRDDRFVAAINLGQAGEASASAESDENGDGDLPARAAKTKAAAAADGSVTLAYIVRAVTPGSYVHPALTVEDMYRPERHARSAASRLEVKAKD